MGDHDVGGRDDILKAIALGDQTTLVGVAANDEDGGIGWETATTTRRLGREAMEEIGHWGVRLDEVIHCQGRRQR